MAMMAMVATSIIGAGVQAMGAMAQANAQASAAEYNAKVAERNATIAKQNAVQEEATKRRETRKVLGSQAAAVGASGLAMQGSPLDVLGETAAMGELDALTIRYNGDNNTESYRQDAQLERMKAKNARTAGAIGAASALIGGVGSTIRLMG